MCVCWDVAADERPDDPDVWTDGCLVTDEVSGFASAGSGVYARSRADAWRCRRWGHFEDLGPTADGSATSRGSFGSLPGPLQTVQRAEFWESSWLWALGVLLCPLLG